jgi:hypothetical protein
MLLMTKMFWVGLCLLFSLHIGLAQTPLKNAVTVMRYQIKSENGTNAIAVTYNPKNDLYYTVFAGNAAYPLEVFDGKGNNKYSAEIGVDVRGLWYNEKKKTLEGLVYPKKGKFSIDLDYSGMPGSLKQINASPSGIPSDQSTASYTGKTLLLFNGESVYCLNPANLKLKFTVNLTNIPTNKVNYTTVVYTGVKGYELAFYNSSENKIYFADMKGFQTGTTKLPADAPQAEAFRFSYTNNLLWLYNAEDRVWFGYRVF